MAWRRRIATATAVCALAAGCGDDHGVDGSKLDFGDYSTAVRTIPERPSLPNGTVLEGIRMSDAVADTSQLDLPLNHLLLAGPIPDTTSTVNDLGNEGKRVLDQHNWVAGYHAAYTDKPLSVDDSAPPSAVVLSVMLLRFADDVAARRAASALETVGWTDFGDTIAAPLPKRPEIAARYVPGSGRLQLHTAAGPFVVRVVLDAPPDGIAARVNDLDAVVAEEQALLRTFEPTPVAEIPSLPRDPDGLLARMVTTDPGSQPPPSSSFAVYGPTGALRDQSPATRTEKLYEKWGVDRLAVSGEQRLYRLRDHEAAQDMATGFAAAAAGEHELEGAQKLPGANCFQAERTTAATPGYVCRLVFDNLYTEVRSDTASSVQQMAAAQYALLANR